MTSDMTELTLAVIPRSYSSLTMVLLVALPWQSLPFSVSPWPFTLHSLPLSQHDHGHSRLYTLLEVLICLAFPSGSPFHNLHETYLNPKSHSKSYLFGKWYLFFPGWISHSHLCFPGPRTHCVWTPWTHLCIIVITMTIISLKNRLYTLRFLHCHFTL